MKGLKLFFIACLAPLVFLPAVADDMSDVARAGTRRNTQQNTSATRQRAKTETKPQQSAVISRTTNAKKSSTTVRERTTSDAPTARTGNVVSDNARATKTTTDKKNVSARATAQTIQPRTIKTSTQVKSRTATTPTRNISRSATLARATIATPGTKTRSATTPTRNISRSATLARATTSADIMSRNFSKCREVFHSCMDEFCANKDSDLRRCACSARVNEFDQTKNRLAQVEDKLLNFSERLLTVNMDEEDVIAMNQATEGELAFAEGDTSASKKMLDKIAKKLNTSFDDSNFDNSLNAISLSLNTDSAFDNVDSLAGASTTLKSGTDLYISALPICREMAQEVCTPDELTIAESGYQMAIEQDCNTVAKSYQTQTDQARTKVLESGALLDISRLDIYQERNSDDILTCKRKMLDMLSDTTVCGDSLGKCLDTSGRYIDPTTGTAFLTADLSQLGNLITRPTGDQTWTRVPENSEFVSFLNTKKEFLEPAMANCQNIADSVWDAFVEDALAQIKLAQEKKLEEVRQSCTTLTAECLTDANKKIADFDARALSIFGIMADKTANTMCADIKNACGALLESSGGGTDWIGGMSQIATEITFDTILHTCREVGRNCIINTCKSTSGNFGLCEGIGSSINRKSIINRTACWDEVLQCVASAGTDALNKISAINPLSDSKNANITYNDSNTYLGNFYSQIYKLTGANTKFTANCLIDETTNKDCIYDICMDECATGADETTCYTCRLAERIWGNCEAQPQNMTNMETSTQIQRNMIRIPIDKDTNQDTGTLLSWFAVNTGTDKEVDSCRDTTCEYGYQYDSSSRSCQPNTDFSNDGSACSGERKITIVAANQNNNITELTNCCNTPVRDSFNNCCASGALATIDTANSPLFGTITPNITEICVPTNNINKATHIVSYTQKVNSEERTYNIFCLTQTIDTSDTTKNTFNEFPSGHELKCNGDIVIIDNKGHYYTVDTNNLLESYASHKLYRDVYYDRSTDIFNWYGPSDKQETCPTGNNIVCGTCTGTSCYCSTTSYNEACGSEANANIEFIKLHSAPVLTLQSISKYEYKNQNGNIETCSNQLEHNETATSETDYGNIKSIKSYHTDNLSQHEHNCIDAQNWKIVFPDKSN